MSIRTLTNYQLHDTYRQELGKRIILAPPNFIERLKCDLYIFDEYGEIQTPFTHNQQFEVEMSELPLLGLGEIRPRVHPYRDKFAWADFLLKKKEG